MVGGPLDGGSGRTLRPLGLGDLLDETFAVYRRGFKTFLAIAAVVHIPVALLALPFIPAYTGFLDLTTRGQEGAQQIARALEQGWVALIVLGILFVVASIVGSVLELGATCFATSAVYLGEPLTVPGAYRAALRRFWALLALGILVGLALLAVFAVALAPLLLAAVANAPALAALLCLSFPAATIAMVYLLVRWSVAEPALMLEAHASPLGALGRSSALIRGAWWRSLLVLLVLYVLLGIVQSVATGVASVLTLVLQFTVAGGGAAAPAWLTALSSLLSSLINMLFAPLLWIGITLLYYDRRVRVEGYDLAVMARELGRPAPAPELP